MPDLLVRLYDLPALEPELVRQGRGGILIRRALAPERHAVIGWVRRHWGAAWASECDCAFARQPVACILACEGERTLGFACYEATARNFFGPIGVHPGAQGRGIGRALLLAALHGLRGLGYGYAIIGAVGTDVQPFYTRTVGAVLIEGSDPGVYAGCLGHGNEP